jgi:hypothetical protein
MTPHQVMGGAALVAVALMTCGCLQLGDYAMSAECEGFSTDLREAVATTWGEGISIENVGAADSAVWCGLEVTTGADVPTDDPHRRELATEVQALVDAKNDRGVQVTIRYGEASDVLQLARPTPAT